MSSDQSLQIQIKANAEQAIAELKTVTGSLKALEKTVKSSKASNEQISKSFKSVNDSMSGLGKTLKGVVAGYIGLQGTLEGIDLAKQAADAQQAADAFNRLFDEMGKNAEEEFAKIKEASMGLIPDAALKQATVTAASLGVPIEKIAQLMEVAVAKSREMGTSATKAFEDLATGIGRGSPMILDNLGLTIKLGDANEEMAKKLHKSVSELTNQEKTIALTNAVIEVGADAVERYADAGLSAKQKMQQFDAQMENLKVQIGDALLPTLIDAEEAISKWVSSLDSADLEALKNGVDGFISTLGTLYDALAKLNDLGMPDFVGGEGAGLLDTVVNGWDELIDRYGFAITATDKLNEAMYRTIGVLGKNRASEKESIASIGEKNDEIVKQIKTLQALHDKISQYSGWSGYEEAIGKVDEAVSKLAEEQLDNLNVMRKLKEAGDPYAEATNGAEKAADAAKTYSKETINALEKDNDARIKSAEVTVGKLTEKEKKLSEDIQKINEDLSKKLAALENSRVARVEAIENKIRGIRRSGMSEYDANVDLIKQKDEELSKARQALADGDMEAYRRHARLYESLIDEIAGKQIDAEHGVATTAELSRKSQISALKTLESLENSYYQKKKQQAQAAHDAAIAQKKAELESAQAELEAQKALIRASQELAQALTGKKIDIDTSSIDRAIAKISQTKQAIDLINATPATVKTDTVQVDAAKAKIEQLRTLTLNGVTLKVDADTTPADFGISQFVTTTSGKTIDISVNPEYKSALTKIETLKKRVSKTPAKLYVSANISPAEAKIAKAKKEADASSGTMHVSANTHEAEKKVVDVKERTDETEGVAKIDADIEEASAKIDETQDKIDAIEGDAKIGADIDAALEKISKVEHAANSAVGVVTIDGDGSGAYNEIAGIKRRADSTIGTVRIHADASEAYSVIRSLERTTYSTHVIHVKKVYDNAEGGYIDAYAAGGMVSKAAARYDLGGRVPGYDPTDSDTVAARLTRGEYVIRRRAVDYYSPSLFDALNRMKLPRFSDGGAVSSGPRSAPTPMRPINLHIGSSSFETMAPADVAASLERYLVTEGGL